VTWAYSGDPSSSTKDAVRFLIGDTDEDDPLVQDEEIKWFTDNWSDHYMAAAAICDSLAGKFAREVNVSADGISYSGNQIAQNFTQLAQQLRQMSGMDRKHGVPYVGGISWKERAKADTDKDRVPEYFRSHMHDHPDSGSRIAPRQQRHPWISPSGDQQ